MCSAAVNLRLLTSVFAVLACTACSPQTDLEEAATVHFVATNFRGELNQQHDRPIGAFEPRLRFAGYVVLDSEVYQLFFTPETLFSGSASDTSAGAIPTKSGMGLHSEYVYQVFADLPQSASELTSATPYFSMGISEIETNFRLSGLFRGDGSPVGAESFSAKPLIVRSMAIVEDSLRESRLTAGVGDSYLCTRERLFVTGNVADGSLSIDGTCQYWGEPQWTPAGRELYEASVCQQLWEAVDNGRDVDLVDFDCVR